MLDKNPMKKIKAVLFDLDGTLTDSMPAHFESWNFALKNYGLAVSYTEFCLTEGADCYTIVDDIFRSKKKYSDKKIAEELCKIKTDNFIKNSKPKLFNHVDDILTLLQTKNIPMALVTGSSLENIKHGIHNSVLEKFKVIVKAGDTERGKPYPDPYTKALQKLNVEPQDALVVENAPYGIKAAKAAGIRCAVVATTLDVSYLSEADIIFKDHKELLTFLEQHV
jgi:beta-phosphoglucomutase